MENPFYSALNFNGVGLNAQQAADNAAGVLLPFVHYLDNSINALKNKEVSCYWRPVVTRQFRLTCQERIYQLVPESEIEITLNGAGWYEILSEEDGTSLDHDFEIDVTEPVTVGKGKSRRQYPLSEHDVAHEQGLYRVFLPDLATDHSEENVISWVGYRLKLRPVYIELGDINAIHIDRQQCEVIKVSDNRIRFKGTVASNSQLSINGQDLGFNVLTTFDTELLNDVPYTAQGNHYLLFSRKKPQLATQKVQDVTAEHFKLLLANHFMLENQLLDPQTWQLDYKSGELVLNMLKNAAFRPEGKVYCERWPQLHFSIAKSKHEENWIQLIEKEGADDSAKSDLDYFFEDRVTILDQSQRRNDGGYRVLKARPEERQLLLASDQKGANRWKSVYPSKVGGSKQGELRVSVDISQLVKQKDALKRLMDRPDVDHQALVNLLQPRQRIRLQDFEPKPELNVDWQVLTDPSFDGCDRQREFVCKALATPDFAILDGPPGTGKTTTILELIIQLVMTGKRILLSASTHAAINNVLERIIESAHLQQHIFPLRIGDESNAIGVEQFQFDIQLRQLTSDLGDNIATKQLLVDSSNLVCGTTIGILRLFNEKALNLDASSPPFDVMIIDECSKTTFQEFLVPARFAKRWILVGDERQLSPFTDREQIVANLDNLMLKPKRGKQKAINLSPDVQQACFLLEELRGGNQRDELYQQPMLVPVRGGVLQALDDEIQARLDAGTHSEGLENIYIIPSSNTALGKRSVCGADRCFVATLKREPWRFYTHTLYFVDQDALDQLNGLIPDDMLIVHPEWQTSAHAFTHCISGKRYVKAVKVKTSDYTSTDEISTQLIERLNTTKWSEELCWRLEREYWLRLSVDRKRKTGHLSTTITRLLPKSVKADGRVGVLRDIAFPSVLEALSGGGLAKRRKDSPTTLNQGFDLHERELRHETLTFQHRMHPDISAFPRKQFYPLGVLKDGGNTTMARAWQYDRYAKRNTWLDVRQGAIFRNSNAAEVETVVRELKAFCDWAVKHPKKVEEEEPEYYDLAVLTFYKGQEKALREAMQKALPGNDNRYARFYYRGVAIKLATVDYFQGQEADLVFLSMVNNRRDGFMDSPNRLNVAITRARYQLVIVGDREYFSKRSRTDELRNLADSSHKKGMIRKDSRSKRYQQGR
ncbi:AAA domain-containing protein [Vibrio sp. PNB22_8_1]|uniref:AAA domain-containing protein n=1 Tax=unclassified Vibrio TaxID=2614977 RepID=UPI00406A6529